MPMRVPASIISLITLTTIAAQTPAQHPDTAVLTVDQCVDIALSQSPTIRVADLEVTRVDYTKRQSIGQLLPTINFGGTYNRMLATQVMYMDMKGMPGADDTPAEDANTAKKKDEGIKMGLDNSFQLGFNASVPVIAPQLWQTLKLNDAQIAQTIEQARASRLDLVNQVKNAYYTLQLAKESRKVIQQGYDMAALTHKIYVDRNRVGDASEYDVLRTSVAVKNLEPDLVQAQIAIRKAHLQLMVLMGMPVETPVDVAGTLNDVSQTMYADVMVQTADSAGYADNTTLEANRLQTVTLERTVKMQKLAFAPTLSLSANYNWTSSSNGSPFRNFRWNPYSVVGITLSVPLFEGGQRFSRLRQAQVQVEQANLTRQDLERTVAMQVAVARDNLTLNVKQISSCAESVGQAERAHDIMSQSFDIGAASYLDLRDSELALTQSRLKYYEAIYNYLVAGAQLELLTGRAVPRSSFTVNK